MISAATASTAVLMVTLVRDHGLQYLLATTILAGLIQVVMGVANLGRLMRFVSRSVMTGFVNALAILIFMAQLPEMIGVPWLTYPLILGSLAIIYLLPRVTRAVPSPLVAIVVATALVWFTGWDVRTVGDLGALPDALPIFLIPDVPLDLETLRIILPYALADRRRGPAGKPDDAEHRRRGHRHRILAQDGMHRPGPGQFRHRLLRRHGRLRHDRPVDDQRELRRPRAAVLLGGGRVPAGPRAWCWAPLAARIPMAALVAVMIMVSVSTFSWSSILTLRTHPTSSSVVMLATVAVVVATHNLALGVLTGVLLSGIFFAGKIARMFDVASELSADGRERRYLVEGQMFFGSADNFRGAFDFREDVDRVVIDVTRAHIWDISSVAALDAAVLKFRARGKDVEVVGMNRASETIVDKLGTHHRPGAKVAVAAH